MTYLTLALRYWKLAGMAVLLIALGVQTARLSHANGKVEARTAERDLALSQRDALIADSKRRVNVGREALREAQTVKAGRDAQRARIVVQQAPGCPTPPEAADILDKGW